ncbi:MAG TPA: tetratricopeptide repeat protein [Streptosporangiaceae bacterium]
MGEVTEAEAISALLPLLARRLQSDESGREIIKRIAQAPEQSAEQSAADLAQWLTRAGTPTVATMVTGGYVGKLANIAHADVVNISLPADHQAPAQLPNAARDFTDREQQVMEASRFLRAEAPETPGAPGAPGAGTPVVVISGPGGIGKSALAVQVSTLLIHDFPDAQLYVDLRGQSGQGLDPGDVLDGFLRAKGVTGTRIPQTTGERELMYRSVMSKDRNLVLLDNAADERQVRPLIPAGSGCAVIITSRRRLAVLDGALPIDLERLSPNDGVALLAKIAGAQRVDAEMEAARQVVRLSGQLPLAIRIAGAKLADRPYWHVGRMADRLRSERTRLAELSYRDLDVRGGIMLSYQELDPGLQRAFRLPSMLAFQSFTSWVVAALLDISPAEADDAVEQLVDLQLLEVVGEDETGEIRYRYHDLLRLFAREQTEESDSEQDRSAAVERALGALLGLAKRALFEMSPHSKRDPDPPRALIWPLPADLAGRLTAQPYDWLSADYGNLIAAITQAHDAGLWECTWELADSMHYYFRVRARLQDWQATHELALDAARRAGNRRGEGWTLRNLGNAYRDMGQLDRAADCFTRCFDTFRELGNSLGQAAALTNLGELAMDRGQLNDAEAHLERSVAAWADVGDKVGVAYVTNHLGWVNLHKGELSTAWSYLERSLAMFRDLDDRWGEAHALRCQGLVSRERGQYDRAEQLLGRGDHLFAGFGETFWRARVRTDLAWTRLAQRRPGDALQLLNSAIAEFRELQERYGEAIALMITADVYRTRGQTDAAAAVLEEVIPAFRGRGDALYEGISRCLLGETYLRAGQAKQAQVTLAGALEVLRRAGAGAWASRASQAMHA